MSSWQQDLAALKHSGLIGVLWMYSHLQGNYDSYMKTRSELEENQMKRYQWERDQMQHMKVRNTASSAVTD